MHFNSEFLECTNKKILKPRLAQIMHEQVYLSMNYDMNAQLCERKVSIRKNRTTNRLMPEIIAKNF